MRARSKRDIGDSRRLRGKHALNDEKELARLRVHIEEITKSIIDLISAREKLSIEVAGIKKKSGVPIENLKVESSLAREVQNYSGELGVDQLLAAKILFLILDSSKTVQRKEYYEDSIRSFLKDKEISKIAVIGAGRMGGWFASYFAGLSVPLIIFDQDKNKSRKLASELKAKMASSLKEIARDADLVVVAIPITDTPRMIRTLASLTNSKMRDSTLPVLELCSVKEPLVKAGLIGKELKKSNVSLYSIHPMFGPDVNHFAQNKLLEISVDGESDGLINGLFPHFQILRLDARTHDRAMSYVLALPHLVALLFADVIASESSSLKKYSGRALIGCSKWLTKCFQKIPHCTMKSNLPIRKTRKW